MATDEDVQAAPRAVQMRNMRDEQAATGTPQEIPFTAWRGKPVRSTGFMRSVSPDQTPATQGRMLACGTYQQGHSGRDGKDSNGGE